MLFRSDGAAQALATTMQQAADRAARAASHTTDGEHDPVFRPGGGLPTAD